MNDHAQQRWNTFSAIFGDERVPLSERMDSAFDFLEQEVRAAFQRGTRAQPCERRIFTPQQSRNGRSALQAGILSRVSGEGR
jgi:hypothetical protein